MNIKLEHRSYKDVWILWIDEANSQIEHLNQYQFNWTLSFRQDSEVSIGAYGLLVQHNEKENLSYNFSYNNSDFIEILAHRNIDMMNMLLEYYILFNYRYRHKTRPLACFELSAQTSF